MKNKRIIIKNILSSLILQAIALVYGFIVPALIIENYGSKVNGLISSITQFIAYIALLELGIGPVIRNALYKPIVQKNKGEIADILGTTDKFFKKIAYIFIGYIVILCIGYPFLVNNDFSFWYTCSLILIISISRFFEYFIGMTYKMLLCGDGKNYFVDYVNAITYIINLLVIVFLIKLNCSIQIVKLVSALVYVLRPICLKVYFDKKYQIKINKKSTYVLEKKWDGLSHHIAATVQSNTDVAILTIFSSLNNVSIYSVYFLVTNGIRNVIISLTNGIDAFFGKLMVENSVDINYKFRRYNLFFYTITTILLSSTIILIIPFVNVYTRNISDINYIQPIFAYVLIFAEFNYVIRYPYSNLVYAKGLFKETRTAAIIEPIINIFISIILVIKFDLIGVAIGTLISMLIRSINFIVYASKNILKVKVLNEFKIIIISFFELCFALIMSIFVLSIQTNNYVSWILYAIIVFIVSAIIIVTINFLFFKNDFKVIFKRRITNEK